MELHEKIKQLRKEAGLSQEELAAKIFVSRTLITKYESGSVFPTEENIKKMADVFGVDVSKILNDEEKDRIINMTKQKTSRAFKAIKIISIVLTCSTLFIALMLVALLDSNNEGIVSFDQMYYMVNNLWVFYLLLPISLGCLGYGIFLSIKKYKAVSNIVIGSVFSFLLLIYGSFTPIFKPQYDTSSKYWDELGEKLSIDFSNDLKVVSMEYDINKQTTSDNFWRNVESAARFTKAESYQAFVNSLNSNWTSSYQNNMVPTTFALSTKSGFGKFLIYSFTDSTYNPTSPISNHKYVCIALSYEKQGMYMFEYTAK